MIFRVTEPAFLATQPMYDLFKEAYADYSLSKAEGAMAGLLPMVSEPTTGLFVGEEKGEFRALAVVLLPNTPLYDTPQVHHFYNGGSSRLRSELLTEMVGFVKDAGYNKWWAINQGGSDKAYERLARPYGQMKVIGSIIEVEFKGDGQPSGQQQ